MQLIYRAQTFSYTPAQPQPYRKPAALNWRWQVPGEVYGTVQPVTLQYQQPRAINWRWQTTQAPILTDCTD
jgi:hypothetical protein